MKEIMDDKVGVFRDGAGLSEAVSELEELYKKSRHVQVKNKKLHNNPELEEAYRVPKMLKLALCVAKGALDRTESRGAHTRIDYPKRDDANWLKRTLASWSDENQTMPTIEYEPLDVMQMEITPDWRGYGAKGNFIPHPDKEKRDAEIAKITRENEEKGGDRYSLQEALMPFELHAEYKVKNQRLGDDK